jgi:hypothetical protein
MRRHAGGTTWADVRHPTQWSAVFRRRAVGVAHRSGADVRFGQRTSAHGARGVTLSDGRYWRLARRVGGLLGRMLPRRIKEAGH